jgi:hypothetical protein
LFLLFNGISGAGLGKPTPRQIIFVDRPGRINGGVSTCPGRPAGWHCGLAALCQRAFSGQVMRVLRHHRLDRMMAFAPLAYHQNLDVC